MLAVFATILINVEQVPCLPLPLQDRRRTKGRPPRGSSPSGKRRQKPCRDYLKEIARTHCVTLGTLPCVKNYKSQAGSKFGEKGSFLNRETDRQPKKAKKGGGKVNVALFWIVKHMGCASQDAEPPNVKSF